MTAQHPQEDWGVYFSWLDDKPASITVDLRWHEPLASHPRLFTYRIWIKQPDEHGFPSRDESESRLYPIEDMVRSALEAVEPALVFVGKMIHEGVVNFYFYGPPQPAQPASGIAGKLFGKPRSSVLNAALDKAIKPFPGCEYACAECDEPQWDAYFSVLSPNAWERHKIMNDRLLRQMQANGDQTGRPRQIDHFIVCPDTDSRAKVTASAQAMGFTARLTDQSDDGSYGVELSKEGIPDNIEEIMFPLFDLAEKQGASYDGWGSVVVREGD